MSRGDGSILVSSPGGSWPGDGHEGEEFVSGGEGSIRAFSFPPRNSGWGLFDESKTALVFSGFLDGTWAGHKLSAVFGNSLRDSGRIELGDERSGVVGGCREGLG